MESIQIAGRNFELASPWKRLAALFIDGLFLICFSCLIIVAGLVFRSMLLSIMDPYYFRYSVDAPFTVTLIIGTVPIDIYRYLVPGNFSWVSMIMLCRLPLLGLWVFGLFFMDGYKNGQSPGKSALNIQVRRLKDGHPCGFKDAFIRRFIGILQPLDFFYIFGEKRQRLGDKSAGTVVVQEVWVESKPAPDKSIYIEGNSFELADRLTRLFALSIDVLILLLVNFGLVFVGLIFLFSLIATGQWEPNFYFLAFTSYATVPIYWKVLDLLTICLWVLGLLFMDGFNGQGIGKRVAGIQVCRLKDGEPCGFKDAFIRRFIGILQPLDFFYIYGKKRQRLGDKLTKTVVVKQVGAEVGQIVAENVVPYPKQIEDELAAVLHKMENDISAARQKVKAAISIEKRFQEAYQEDTAQAEQCYKNAAAAVKIGREDSAREELKKRDEYLRLAEQQKKQWENQQQSVQAFKDVLVSLEQEMMAAEVRGTVILAQHKNVDAETHLREVLKEMQSSKALEKVVDLEQEVIEDVILVKAMDEADKITDQDMELEREFLDHTEERSIDEELAALKETINKENRIRYKLKIDLFSTRF